MAANIVGLDRLLPRIFPPHFLREWDHGESRAVDQVMGAFFMVRRELFQALGGFDQRFFVYYEDLDFALRARQHGWATWYVAEASAEHAGGGTTAGIPAQRLFYVLRSRTLYSRKHFGAVPAVALAVLALFVEPLSRIVGALIRLDPAQVRNIVAAYVRFWLCIPRLVLSSG